MLGIDTSLKVGNLSKLVFVEDPPRERVSASRSAGDGANARMDSVEKIESGMELLVLDNGTEEAKTVDVGRGNMLGALILEGRICRWV